MYNRDVLPFHLALNNYSAPPYGLPVSLTTAADCEEWRPTIPTNIHVRYVTGLGNIPSVINLADDSDFNVDHD
jgi:hypothetical protein